MSDLAIVCGLISIIIFLYVLATWVPGTHEKIDRRKRRIASSLRTFFLGSHDPWRRP